VRKRATTVSKNISRNASFSELSAEIDECYMADRASEETRTEAFKFIHRVSSEAVDFGLRAVAACLPGDLEELDCGARG